MNWKRGALAGGAGAISAVVILAGGFAVLATLVQSISFMGGTSLGYPLLFLQFLSLIGIAAASALPLRVLGAGWLRSIISIAVAYVTGAFMAFGIMPSIAIFDSFITYLSVLFVVSAYLAVLISTIETGIGVHVEIILICVATFIFLISLAVLLLEDTAYSLLTSYSPLIGLAAWIILPTIVGLYQPRRESG